MRKRICWRILVSEMNCKNILRSKLLLKRMFDNLIIIVISRHYGHSSAQSDVKYARGKTNILITRCGAELCELDGQLSISKVPFIFTRRLINKNTSICYTDSLLD
jgi:hypothetical protein